MSKTLSETERVAQLNAIGINPDGAALAALPANTEPMGDGPVLAPPGVDPRLQPVDEIVFDERLLDGFESLDGDGLARASAHVFSLYKSYTKDKPRNSALHRRITSFITGVRRNRQTGGMVTEGIKTTKADRDLAALIASQGVGADDIAEGLRLLAEKRGGQ